MENLIVIEKAVCRGPYIIIFFEDDSTSKQEFFRSTVNIYQGKDLKIFSATPKDLCCQIDTWDDRVMLDVLEIIDPDNFKPPTEIEIITRQGKIRQKIIHESLSSRSGPENSDDEDEKKCTLSELFC